MEVWKLWNFKFQSCDFIVLELLAVAGVYTDSFAGSRNAFWTHFSQKVRRTVIDQCWVWLMTISQLRFWRSLFLVPFLEKGPDLHRTCTARTNLENCKFRNSKIWNFMFQNYLTSNAVLRRNMAAYMSAMAYTCREHIPLLESTGIWMGV